MRIFLIAGSEHPFIAVYLQAGQKAVVVNKKELTLHDVSEYLKDAPSPSDTIVITDGGLSSDPDANERGIEQLFAMVDADIFVITRDFALDPLPEAIRTVHTRWLRADAGDFDPVFDGKTRAKPAVRKKRGVLGLTLTGTEEERERERACERARERAREREWEREDKQEHEREDKREREWGQEQEPEQERKREREQEQNREHGQRQDQKRAAGAVKKARKWGAPWRKSADADAEEFSSASLASSKVIVFTGRRGAGSTSAAVNVALSASGRGVKTMLADMDTVYRSANLYFGEFYKQAEEDEHIESSLTRTLAQPQSYQTSAITPRKNLWLTALGYGFDDRRLLEQHFTESKIIGFVTALKHSFDLTALDLPLYDLARFPNLLNCVDVVALCVENTLYGAFSTMRDISISFSERERIAYLASKSKLIATKYNDESTFNDEIITPDRLSEMIANEGFCESFTTEMPVAGSVPYIKWFGRQIENDIPVMDLDARLRKAYDDILLRLLGGAR